MRRMPTKDDFKFSKGRNVNRSVIAALALGALVIASYSPPPRSVNPVHDRGELRVVTLESPTTYAKNTRGTEGVEFRLAEEFARQRGLTLYMYPVASVGMMQAELASGRADIAAAQITANADWWRAGDAAAVYQHIPQLVVYHRGDDRPDEDDLATLHFLVRAGSPQESLLDRLKHTQTPGISWTATSAMAVDPLQDVQNGVADYAVVDAREYAANRRLYPDVLAAFPLPEERPVQWVVRHTDPDLYTAVNEFFSAATGQQRQQLASLLLEPSPAQEPHWLTYQDKHQFSADLSERLPQFQDLFKEAGAATGQDWRLLAAIGYQESKWDPDAASPAGASGLMMLTSDTADSLGVADRNDPRENILAGARYLKEVRSKIPAHIQEPDRTWLAIAAYNVGYGHVEDARKLAQMRGKNPDSWQDVREQLPLLADENWYEHVKHGFARGTEPLQFVDRIQRFLKLMELRTASAAEQEPDMAERATRVTPGRNDDRNRS